MKYNRMHLLLIIGLAMTPALALADEHVAGQWRSDLGHGVIINMDLLVDGHWTSQTIQDDKVVAEYAGTYEQTPINDTHGKIVMTPLKSHATGNHHEAKVETDTYVISDGGKVATFTSGKDKLVFHNVTVQ
jgi:hypothetical protein